MEIKIDIFDLITNKLTEKEQIELVKKVITFNEMSNNSTLYGVEDKLNEVHKLLSDIYIKYSH